MVPKLVKYEDGSSESLQVRARLLVRLGFSQTTPERIQRVILRGTREIGGEPVKLVGMRRDAATNDEYTGQLCTGKDGDRGRLCERERGDWSPEEIRLSGGLHLVDRRLSLHVRGLRRDLLRPVAPQRGSRAALREPPLPRPPTLRC